MVQRLAAYFFRGLLVVVPGALTVWVVYRVFLFVDGAIDLEPLVGRRVPGLGLLVTLALIFVVGLLASSIFTRWLVHLVDRAFVRLPLVRLLYTAIKDLIGAFVGERRGFDRPVLVRLFADESVQLMGFATRDDLAELGLAGHTAVYLPQSYNFAGNVVLVPDERIRPLDLESSRAMAFIMSGGVARAHDPAPLAAGATARKP